MKPLFLSICCIISSLAVAHAEETGPPPLIPLWNRDAAAIQQQTVVRDHPDQPELDAEENLKITVAAPSLQIFSPAPGKASRAAVVICPGGGYGRLFIQKEGIDYARFLAAHGYLAAVLRYRLPRPDSTGEAMPLPIADGLRALQLLRAEAGPLGIDPGKIGIMGSSAGGHLAAACAAYGAEGDPDSDDPAGRQSSKPNFLILCYPVISGAAPFAHAGSFHQLLGPHPAAGLLDRYSIERQVRAGWPPTFVVETRDDPIHVENSLLLIQAIEKAGGSIEAFLPDRGGHGFGLARDRPPPLSEWPQRLLDWLQGRVR